MLDVIREIRKKIGGCVIKLVVGDYDEYGTKVHRANTTPLQGREFDIEVFMEDVVFSFRFDDGCLKGDIVATVVGNSLDENFGVEA